ncbi:DUF6624 domain-containing protein [Thalassotalea agarivorans]|uniref:Uncharacterized protein n=1 Tax=Thalassotalea agarivorans TaxID=349064 RepID=A0A1I0CBZ9_THASX|nr:DUF6624 domain-containing protein [Thalassotalea agarivorans]SET16880.1 hypothetical protein SAMN05660429_01137 [Thalassotalea agarivorans]
MRYLIYFIAFFSFTTSAESVKDRLVALEQADQAVREKVRLTVQMRGVQGVTPELIEQHNQVDRDNTIALKAMLKSEGLNAILASGDIAIDAFSLIVQHSHDQSFQLTMIEQLHQAFQKDAGISGVQLALLTDRVLVKQKKKQRYGTQVDIKVDGVSFKPIENPSAVNARRAELGLPTLKAYCAEINEKFNYDCKEIPD